MLADMETKINCARALIYDTAQKKDLGMDITKEAAMAKYFASEMCNEVAAKALQLHGGYGYMKDYPIERISGMPVSRRSMRVPLKFNRSSLPNSS